MLSRVQPVRDPPFYRWGVPYAHAMYKDHQNLVQLSLSVLIALVDYIPPGEGRNVYHALFHDLGADSENDSKVP
jgi:hypothetical protein